MAIGITEKPPRLTVRAAENIAAVVVELQSRMLETADEDWPMQYRYDAFGGFPGWYSFCSIAGRAFDIAFEALLEPLGIADHWVEMVEAFADMVFDDIQPDVIQLNAPPGFDELKAIAYNAIQKTLGVETGGGAPKVAVSQEQIEKYGADFDDSDPFADE